MNLNRLGSLAIAFGCFMNMWEREDLETALGFFLACLIILSLIWFARFWVNYILPFCFWGYQSPGDMDNPAYEFIIPLFGWVLLLLLFFLSW